MLPEPPCIPGFIGCDSSGNAYSGSSGGGGSTGGYSGGQSSSASSGFGGFSSSSSSKRTSSFFGSGAGSGGASSTGFSVSSRSSSSTGFAVSSWSSSSAGFVVSSRSSSSRPSIFANGNGSRTGSSSLGYSYSPPGPAFSHAGQTAASQTMRITEYTISAVNRGTQTLKNVVLTHGPIPSGVTFDPSRSSQGCAQAGTSVQCTTDLSAGQTKTLTLSYQAQNSQSCALAKSLQTATSTVNGVTGSPTSGVSTSVGCEMKTVASSASSSSSSSYASTSVGMPAVANGAYGGSGAYVGAPVYGSGARAPGMIVGQNGQYGNKQTGYKPTGYKPYASVRMPRTGAADLLFSSTKDYTLSSVRQPSSESSFPITVVLLSTIVLGVVGGVLIKRALFA